MATLIEGKSSTLTFVAKPNKFISHELIQQLPELLPNAKLKPGNKFLNCVSVEFLLDKLIVCKVFKNGTLQITGCKNKTHPIAVCRIVQQILDCCYTITLAMENIYTDLGFRINKLALYKAWKTKNYATPPMGTYTAVRLKMSILNYTKTDYMVTPLHTLIFHSRGESGTVNIAVFYNGKVLLSGLNKSCITQAIVELKQVIEDNPHVRVLELASFE